MRTSSPYVLLLTLAVAACSGHDVSDRVTAPPSPSLDRGGEPQAERQHRFTGTCETTFNPPPLPLPPVHHQTDTGTCRFAPFGRMTLESVQDINFAAGTQSGHRTFTARNGDQIFAVHSGTSAPSGPGLISFSATVTIVGGTGRFANATGTARVEGTANLATRSTVSRYGGWIALNR